MRQSHILSVFEASVGIIDPCFFIILDCILFSATLVWITESFMLFVVLSQFTGYVVVYNFQNIFINYGYSLIPKLHVYLYLRILFVT
jgi:hypothetical protein